MQTAKKLQSNIQGVFIFLFSEIVNKKIKIIKHINNEKISIDLIDKYIFIKKDSPKNVSKLLSICIVKFLLKEIIDIASSNLFS